jgi:hypothetical protein
MNEQMEKILADKTAERERVVALPFDQKITLLEKLRDRNFLIQRPTVVTVTGNVVVSSVSGARISESTPPPSHQLQGQWHAPQNSGTLFVVLRKPPARWIPEQVEGLEPEFAFQPRA